MEKLSKRSCTCIFVLLAVMLLALLLAVTLPQTALASESEGLWETEGNNTSSLADVVLVNQKYNGALSSSSDVDWFKFTVEHDGYFYVEFNHDILSSSEDHWKLSLYDDTLVNGIDCTGDQYYWGVGGQETSITTGKFGVTSGTYYMEITSYSSKYHSSTPYNFTIHFTESNTWETENNSTSSTADEVFVNQKYNGALSSSYDVDWYKFTVEHDGYFYVEFNHAILSSSDTYWELYLYDDTLVSGIDRVGSSYYDGVGGQETSYATSTYGIAAGTYYLKIRGNNYTYAAATHYRYSSTPYNFTIHFTESNTWETENNNTMSTADTLEIGKLLNGTLSSSYDTDWYKIEITTQKKIAVRFDHDVINSSSSYWTIYLYDSTGITKLLTYSRRGNTATAVSDYVDVSSGTYYLKVVKDNYSSAKYKIGVYDYHTCVGTWSVTTSPTCTAVGEKQKVCTVCGKIETEQIDAKGHSYGNWVVTTSPTCTEQGEETRTCTGCGKKETNTVAALGHDYDDGVRTKNATLFRDGETTYTCSRCSKSYKQKIDALIPTWFVVVSIIVAMIVLIIVIRRKRRG